MPNVWTINNATGGKDKSDLVGCHINLNAAGTAYQFTQPNVTEVLATTPGTSLPAVPFNFPQFPYKGYSWDISVTTLTGGASNNQAEGGWVNSDPSIAAESGGWQAQAGAGAGDDEEVSAASA
jgi:hypothetical protein